MLQYKNNLLKLMLFGYGGLMLLLIGMSTGARVLNSDTLFQDGILVIALDAIIAIVDAFAFAIASAVVIYGIYLLGIKPMKTVFAAFFAVTTFHYVAVLFIGWIIYPGTMPQNMGEWLYMVIESLLLYILIDCLRIFVVGLICAKVVAKREAARLEENRKAKILGDEIKEKRSIAFPLTGIIGFKNPMHIAVAAAAFAYWVIFFIQYAYYAVMNLIKLNFWEYLGFQILELGFYTVMAFICYAISLYIIIKLDEKMPKAD
jgi:hypothetical protein